MDINVTDIQIGNFTDVQIRAVVLLSDRPSLTPALHSFVNVADVQTNQDWWRDEHGQIIPTKTKQCFVKKVAKNGSFFACGRWFKQFTTEIYISSDRLGTLLTYI